MFLFTYFVKSAVFWQFTFPDSTFCRVEAIVKGQHYIPPLTWTWPAAICNAKWRTDQQWH